MPLGASGSTNLPEKKRSHLRDGGLNSQGLGSKGQKWADEKMLEQYFTAQSQEDGEQLLNDLHNYAL